MFSNIMFPKGLYAEDLATTYLFLNTANKILFYNRCLYVYRIRANSIMTTRSDKLVKDVYRISCEKYEFEKKHFSKHLKIIETNYCNTLLKTLAWMINNKKEDSSLYQDITARLSEISFIKLYGKTRMVYFICRVNLKLFSKIMHFTGYDR